VRPPRTLVTLDGVALFAVRSKTHPPTSRPVPSLPMIYPTYLLFLTASFDIFHLAPCAGGRAVPLLQLIWALLAASPVWNSPHLASASLMITAAGGGVRAAERCKQKYTKCGATEKTALCSFLVLVSLVLHLRLLTCMSRISIRRPKCRWEDNTKADDKSLALYRKQVTGLKKMYLLYISPHPPSSTHL
jgi:hypothetical protein